MGGLGRIGGRFFTRKNQKALQQLRAAFPRKSDEELQRILTDMWENLGRYVGEFPHIARLSREAFMARAEIIGKEHIEAAEALGKGVLLFSAHMGNWELGAKAGWALGKPFAIVYRPLNNPYTDKATTAHRNHYQVQGLPKGAKGNRQLLRLLKAKGRIAVLIDQKFSGGTPVPFFGTPAPTSLAVAELALRFGAPIVPCQVERLADKTRFRITFHPPIVANAEKDTPLSLMEQLHHMLETWISARPEQWFWLHKRWETLEESRKRKGIAAD